MINFSASTIEDVPQLKEWIAHDPYHFHQGQSEWWLTGMEGSLLAFLLTDERGPLTFVRLDREGEHVRIHTQFAPRAEVSQRRLVAGMIQCLDALVMRATVEGFKGMIFNSINPSLISFMGKRFGFKRLDKTDDYVLRFEQGEICSDEKKM